MFIVGSFTTILDNNRFALHLMYLAFVLVSHNFHSDMISQYRSSWLKEWLWLCYCSYLQEVNGKNLPIECSTILDLAVEVRFKDLVRLELWKTLNNGKFKAASIPWVPYRRLRVKSPWKYLVRSQKNFGRLRDGNYQ